jgi:hypothetical protein
MQYFNRNKLNKPKVLVDFPYRTLFEELHVGKMANWGDANAAPNMLFFLKHLMKEGFYNLASAGGAP